MFSLRSSQRRLAGHQLSYPCSVTEVGQDTFRSNRGTQLCSDSKKTAVTWRELNKIQEVSVLLVSEGDVQ